MNGLRSLFYNLPVSWRYLARRLWYLPSDTWQDIAGKRNPMVPPQGMIYTGGGDFEAQGHLFLNYFRTYADLQPDQHVLDVGSGIGRMAVPLTNFLSEKGRYEGFDVVKKGIDWCNKHITTRHSNFTFRYVALANDLYNESEAKATDFQFPYPDAQFDFVFLISVFTHMLPEEVEHYLSEIQRVLKPDGVAFSTFFVLNDRAKSMMKGSEFDFRHDLGHYRLLNEKVKAANVAFEEGYLQEKLLNANGFQLVHMLPGYWSGIPKVEATDFQDIVVARKR